MGGSADIRTVLTVPSRGAAVAMALGLQVGCFFRLSFKKWIYWVKEKIKT